MTPRPDARAVEGPLSDELAQAARELGARAQQADGVDALSEATLLGLTRESSRHVVVSEADLLLAYAQVWVDGSAELVVDPEHRRGGIGSRVLQAAREHGAERFWAHGDLPAARALGASHGLRPVRELRHMLRPLAADDADAVALPDGYAARTFVPGRDEEAWLRTNARAFADHPEQGRVGRADLDALIAQPWFDADGFFVVEEVGAAGGRVAAFHWTKVVPGDQTGEVFVVGIDPDHQGRGLAGPLTRLGLAHLAGLGLTTVELYVDGGNDRAVRTYERLGFRTDKVDVVYA